MPKNDPPVSVPVRGTPGGWRDSWDDPDDHAALRARAEAAECRQLRRAEVLGVEWQHEIRAECQEQERQQTWHVPWHGVCTPCREGVTGRDVPCPLISLIRAVAHSRTRLPRLEGTAVIQSLLGGGVLG